VAIIARPRAGAAAPTAFAGWLRTRQGQDFTKKAISYILLIFISALLLLPFVWMVSSSLKLQDQVFNPNWIPNPIAWSNYAEALAQAPFDVYFRNTLIMVIPRTIGTVLSASLVAYSFARLKWPGRDLWFGALLATMMLPGVVTWIPQYILFSKLGWVNTFLPLIVPAWFSANGIWIFLLRQFFRGIPMELSEAAKIDGASELRIWWQIVTPLVTPALAFVGISAFTQAWQDFQGPLIYLSTENNYVLQLGLIIFKASGGGVPQWHYLMAASVMVMLPVLILFFIGQRYFTEGVTLTGIKG
jgi:ABC-type glycerol-3-phosphate transport system permease component